MSDISELSTRQKTDLLASAAGWTIDGVIVRDADGQNIGICWEILSRPSRVIPDLYDERSMALSWRIARWAAGQEHGAIAWEFTQWWAMESLHDLPPEQAQEKWLDEVLRLAIATGIVQLEDAAT